MSATAEDPHRDAALIRLGPDPADARLTTVLVHGRDQDDAVTRDLAARVDVADVAHVLLVAPQRSWYPGRYFDPPATLEPHLASALAAIDRAIAATGAPDARIVLAGFSQGACLVAEHLARRGPRRFAGAAILTGCLLGAPGQRARPVVAAGLPVVVTCAREDAWIATDDARDTARRFAAAGADASFVELPDREHQVSDAAVGQLRALLR